MMSMHKIQIQEKWLTNDEAYPRICLLQTSKRWLLKGVNLRILKRKKSRKLRNLLKIYYKTSSKIKQKEIKNSRRKSLLRRP